MVFFPADFLDEAGTRRTHTAAQQRSTGVRVTGVCSRPQECAGNPPGEMSTYVYVDGESEHGGGRGGGWGGGGREQQGSRKPVQRRTVDYTATTVRHLEVSERDEIRERERESW